MSDATLNIMSQILPQVNVTVVLPHKTTFAFTFLKLFCVTDSIVCVYLHCFDFPNPHSAFPIHAHFWHRKLTSPLHLHFRQAQCPISVSQWNNSQSSKTKAKSLLFLFAILLIDRHPRPRF